MHDLVVRGGIVVDGSGAPRRRADVAVDGGVVAEVGLDVGPGRREIDASGRLVTPGFVDPHTHLDAQFFWDATGAPSLLHGVTSVVIGNCGFGVAPVPPSAPDYLLRVLEFVEEIPFEATAPIVPFSWRTWTEYLDVLDGLGLGVNVAGYAPHSALRYGVMGERARHEVADDRDRARLVEALESCLAGGAVGISSSRGPNHLDSYGSPVPSRLADDAEMRALAEACAGRVWHMNVRSKLSASAAQVIEELDLYTGWTIASGARFTWTSLIVSEASTLWRELLRDAEARYAASGLVCPQVSIQPFVIGMSFGQRSLAGAGGLRVAGWEKALNGFDEMDHGERRRLLADPGVREAMREAGTDGTGPMDPCFDRWLIGASPSRPDLVGATLYEALGTADPVGFLLDLVLADDLATVIQVPAANTDKSAVIEVVRSGATLVGLGDAGAHLGSVTNYSYPTYFLAQLVRDDEAFTVEEAVHELTARPAAFLGLQGRGALCPGSCADLCVIDLDRLALDAPEVRQDLPGGAPRLYQGATGYDAIVVNGTVTVERGELTGRRAGRILRC